ncbi:hypothetical protein [Pinibacter soli]|uniref:MafI family immunity protein n=1 Tax=Pinibacter soli TaxID=3044211 RepID=A0ABT6RFW7_9BACT|nr:hypothetical protein [Pinibacter soli]MDI3320747.1 hypothetical protein [Pinibacter soli]
MTLGKQKTIEFIDQIEAVAKKENFDNCVKDGVSEYNEKMYLTRLVAIARELILYNEWFIALENTIDNLFEVDYKLDSDIVNLAIQAFNSVPSNNPRLKDLEQMIIKTG